MTDFLLRLFVKNSQNVEDSNVRAAYGSLSGLVGIVCNLLLFAGKLSVGLLAGSVAIVADAVNNLSDAASSIVTLVGFKMASKPADADHPFGHARMEYLSGLAVAVMILLIGVELAKGSVEKILHPEPVAFSTVLVVVLALSIGVKLWMSLFNRKLGRKISSKALEAAAADSRNDVIATAAVLAAAVIGKLTNLQIDGYAGLLVAAFILWSGIGLVKETVNPLLGENADPELRKILIDEVRSNDKVLGFHDLMVHDYGPWQRFASIHVEMDNREDVLVCHDIIDDIERRCLEEHHVHLVIHYDPVVTDDQELLHMRSLMQAALKEFDRRLSLHDFRMVRGPGHTNLIFDVMVPYGTLDQKFAIQDHLEEKLKEESHKYYLVITFDDASFNELEENAGQ